MINVDDDIIPYCIWHYIDLDTNTFLGYISEPRKYKKNDVVSFDCDLKINENWVFGGTFYATAPNFRPIPVGMKILCAKKSSSVPPITRDIYLMKDPYNIKDDCVYFATYTQPVPNTIPLYFHSLKNNIFPSFDPNPPSKLSEWTQTIISPVFVMQTKYEKFKCINGRCIPWISEIKSLYDTDPHDELLGLHNCVVYCNNLVLSKNEGKPFNILDMVLEQRNAQKSIYLLYIIFIFLIIIIIIIISLIIKKKLKIFIKK